MKKTLLQIAFFVFASLTIMAQAPQKFNYQGIARSSTGAPLASTAIGLQLTVHDGAPGGAGVYQETHSVTTNAYGLYNVAVGGGTVVSGTFNTINWGGASKYLEVGIDAAGGSSYTSAGTAQLLSVPYALYAANSPSVSGTANYIPKFTGATSLGNSSVYNNGSTVGINTTAPSTMAKLHIKGIGVVGSSPIYSAGVIVDSNSSSVNSCGVYSEGGWRGIFGRNPGIASGVQAIGVYGLCQGSAYTSAGLGVKGEATGSGPTNYGVYGNAANATGNNYGVYGTGAGAGYAGYFAGSVRITGSISKGSGTFLIDHPLDPENKYLYHSFVESPDMMNVYNGNTVTDATGAAVITLPDYFEALNKDFRYQLTTIGQPAQVWVSKEISGNKFEVKSDKPNVKVSWQVTGVRQDKFANEHRVVPEVEKEAQFKGHYLHAAEWGQPHEKSFDAITTPKDQEDNSPAKH